MTKFLLVGLPRSRTAWLQALLGGCGTRKVGHDLLVLCRCYDDFLEYYRQGGAGSCETAGMLAWRLFMKRMPEARVAIVRRDPWQVVESLMKQGWPVQASEIMERDAMLDAMALQPGVRSYRFEDLSDEAVVKDLVEHCTAEKFNRQWWQSIANTNIQIDLQERWKYLQANAAELAAFKASALAEAAKMGPCRGLH